MSSPREPLAYTLERAAEVCGGIVSLYYLQQAVRRGEIEHVRIGRSIGVTPQQLRDWLDAHKVARRNATRAHNGPIGADAHVADDADGAAAEVDPDDVPAKSAPRVVPPAIELTSITPRSRTHHSRKAAARKASGR